MTRNHLPCFHPGPMRILDLCCGAGGAAMGYHRVFPDAEIVGVDVVEQPNYPFTFVRADAMTFDLDGFDFIHASPPCHDHSTVTGRSRKAKGALGTGWMLEATAARLDASGVPWVIENVEAAKMPAAGADAFRLCGSSFDLDVRRHRRFISSFVVLAPPCSHGWQTPRFRSLDSSKVAKGVLASVVGVHGHLNYAGEFPIRCAAMGIDWMTNAELTQAIPPAYTEHIGLEFARTLQGAAA